MFFLNTIIILNVINYFENYCYNIFKFFRIITGCYDNSIHIWTCKGKHKTGISGHTGPVKAVQWISVSNDSATFVR